MFATLALLVLAPFTLLGLAFAYMGYRFARKPEVDDTAGFLWYVCTCWALATQPKSLAGLLSYIGRELTEQLDIRKDDGIVK